MNTKLHQLFKSYQQDFDQFDSIKTLVEGLSTLDIGWRVYFTIGFFDFRILYLYNREDGNWLIVSAVVCDDYSLYK